MKATNKDGSLIPINDCYIRSDDIGLDLLMKILPEISDGKGAQYSDETAIGRSFPIKNYSYSENRTISWTVHLMVCKEGDIEEIISDLRKLEALVYPTQQESPYAPPPLCQIKCGRLLGEDELCCVLKSYSVKFPTDVAWDETTYLPYKLDVELSLEVVYDSADLPYAEDIIL